MTAGRFLTLVLATAAAVGEGRAHADPCGPGGEAYAFWKFGSMTGFIDEPVLVKAFPGLSQSGAAGVRAYPCSDEHLWSRLVDGEKKELQYFSDMKVLLAVRGDGGHVEHVIVPYRLEDPGAPLLVVRGLCPDRTDRESCPGTGPPARELRPAKLGEPRHESLADQPAVENKDLARYLQRLKVYEAVAVGLREASSVLAIDDPGPRTSSCRQAYQLLTYAFANLDPSDPAELRLCGLLDAKVKMLTRPATGGAPAFCKELPPVAAAILKQKQKPQLPPAKVGCDRTE